MTSIARSLNTVGFLTLLLLLLQAGEARACSFALMHATEVERRIAALAPALRPVRDLTRRPEFLSIAVDSVQWRHWMARSESSKMNPLYLQNSKAALEQFDAWFRTGKMDDFEAMMNRNHELSALGDGTTGGTYTTVTNGSPYSSGGTFPGIDRYSFVKLGSEKVIEGLRERKLPAFKHHSIEYRSYPVVWPSWADRKMVFPLELQIDLTAFTRATEPFVERQFRRPPAYRHPATEIAFTGMASGQAFSVRVRVPAGDGGPIGPKLEWPTRVHLDEDLLTSLSSEERIKVLPANRMKNGIEHEAPAPKYLPLYTEMGRRLMQKLRKSFDTNLPDADYLDTLADYYHVMINSHRYFRINNSALMSQVNYLLRMRGFEPVLHGKLDYWANFLGTQEFRRLFRAHLAESLAARPQ